MKTFCTTSGAWLSHPERVCALIARSIESDPNTAASVLIDHASVLREQNACQPGTIGILEIDLREWVSDSLTEGGVINVDAVRRRAQTFAQQDIVLIVATGFLPEIITKTLEHLRLGLYSAETWPRAVAIACDDALLYQVMPALAHAFYLRPSIVVETAVNRHARNLMWQGNTLRRFGGRAGTFALLIRRTIDKTYAWLENKAAKKRRWNSVE